VNNEENHKDNDETIERNDVKSKQLVTQLQSNNCVTLKTSEFTTHSNSSKQPQLAAKPTTNTDQKRVRTLFLLVDCTHLLALMEVLRKQTQIRN
jgi:hypothetical protein